MSHDHATPGHHAAHAGEGGHAPGTFKGYMTGFILSVILTVIPFWLVMDGVLASSNATALAILLIGAVQMVVHMVYFLHMSPRSEGGWTLLALIFTVIIVAIALAGSLWVMYHLNVNMMPEHLHDMSSM
ncbi:cytochrome o ubiquinol oxidase subunit IV [Castellaniella ginsengisoli]|uniref:Cytochrome bo(3) ubiquinol oxidase subunit 4 n=1 Tax=Castellaniella ginsengisoli TaxID=546114 RepID=A0ABP3W295_9BURK